MPKFIVAVGSTRRPKLNAVWEALTILGPVLEPNEQFEVIGEEAASGVSHTPLARSEIMTGAKNRADALAGRAQRENKPWKFFVGLEGGLDVVSRDGGRLAFLENWAYVRDSSGRGAYGQSGSVVLPDVLVKQVVDGGVELGVAIDEFAGGHGIRDAQGAWGVLTKNLITRQDAFRVAIINAFAPFFNSALYEQARSISREQ